MSIAFNLQKVYYQYHPAEEHFQTEADKNETAETGLFRFTQGLIEHPCEDQSMDTLDYDKKESIIITVTTIPFIRFYILPEPEQRYKFTSISPISLKTYEEQGDRSENWGTYKEIGDCISKAISITAGFINGLKTGEINDGNYYENDEG